MAKNKLSIYLIKQDFPVGEIVPPASDNGTPIIELQIKGHESCKLFVRATKPHEPEWANAFFNSAVESESLKVANIGAALVIPVLIENNSFDAKADEIFSSVGEENRRYFVLTFGYGRTLINRSAIEERFGLKCVLNSVKNDTLRAIHFADVSGSAKRSSEQLSRMGDIDDFAIDTDRNLLSQVTAKCGEDDLLCGTVTGGDSLAVTKEIDVNNVQEFLKSLYELFCQETYKQDFDWVDNIAPVKDPALEQELWDESIRQIADYSYNDDSQHDLWMAVPDIINWDEIEGFQIGSQTDKNKRPVLHDDVLLADVIRSFKKPIASIEQLKNRRITAISRKDDMTYRHWQAHKCLVGELTYDSKSYCVISGVWYEIQSDYLEKINADFRDTSASEIQFIPYDASENMKTEEIKGFGGKLIKLQYEGKYNLKLERSLNFNKECALLMDRRLVSYGGKNSRIEFCDVLTNNGKRIHVKQYTGSETMSHLFNQGLVSASMEKDAADYARLVDDKIKQIGKHESISSIEQFQLALNPIHEVVFAIVRKRDNRDLPFFSKVALCSVKKQLKRMGIETKLNWIDRINEPKGQTPNEQ